MGRVDHLTRQAEAQGDAYDALVSSTASTGVAAAQQ